MDEFRLRNLGAPSESVVSENYAEPDIESARQECESTVQELAEMTSGYGELPAERYLLRFEYGFNGKQLEDAFDVSISTISKQTIGMRRQILRFPALSRIVGQFRTERAGLERPEPSDSPLLDDEVDLGAETANIKLTLHHGDPSCTYSWKYRLQSVVQEEEFEKHLLIDYLVDAEYGVLLKRRLRGISQSLDSREPYYENKRQYSVYALPHTALSLKDGSVMYALEYMAPYDLDTGLKVGSWDSLKSKMTNIRYESPRSPAYSENKTLLDRLKLTVSTNPISEYSQEKHLRDNLEHLLRVYPLEDQNELPSNTIDSIWNGSLEHYASDGDARNALKMAFETSEVHRVIGDKGY